VHLLPPETGPLPTTCELAAFLRSPLSLQLLAPLPGDPATVLGLLAGRQMSLSELNWQATLTTPNRALTALPTEWLRDHTTLPEITVGRQAYLDSQPPVISQALAIRRHMIAEQHRDPLTYQSSPVECLRPSRAKLDSLGWQAQLVRSRQELNPDRLALLHFKPAPAASTSNLRVSLSGQIDGLPFTRLAWLSLWTEP
jgi:hypothetical protein